MQAVTTIGLDIAKSVFQVHGVDAAGQVLIRRQLKRRYVLASEAHALNLRPPAQLYVADRPASNAVRRVAAPSSEQLGLPTDGVKSILYVLCLTANPVETRASLSMIWATGPARRRAL